MHNQTIGGEESVSITWGWYRKPAREIISAFFLFSAFCAGALGQGTLGTTSTIICGDVSPTIVVSLAGDEFKYPEATDPANWTIDGGTTELTATGIAEGDVSPTEVRISFSGSAKMGYLTLRANAAAVTGAVDSADMILNVKLPSVPTNLTFTSVYGEAPAPQSFNLIVPSDVSPTDYLLGTNQAWLSVADHAGDVSGTALSGTTNAITVTIVPDAVSPTDLSVGRHTGTITVGSNWLDVGIVYDVVLRPDPTNLTFNARYGDAAPITNRFVMSVPSDVSPTDYLLGTNQTWLSAANAEGEVSATIPGGDSNVITVVVSPDGLSVGSHAGEIAAGSNWLDVAVNVVVDRGIDAITFGNTNQVYDGTARSVLATAAHAHDVSPTVTYDGNAWAPTNAGTYIVTGVVDGANWTCTNITTLVVDKALPAVTTWPTASEITYGQALSNSVLNGGAVSPTGMFAFAIPGTTPNAGAYNAAVTFTPTDEANYYATNGTVSVTVSKADQAITFAEIQDQTVTSVVALSATSDSGLPVSFAASGPAVLTNNTLTFTGTGTVSVVASQAGDTNRNAAASVTNSFLVKKLDQTITFAEIPDQVVTSLVTLGATSDSGLPVTFAAGGQAVITDGNKLSFKGAGSASVVAMQDGDETWNAAATVTRTFRVAKADQTITFAEIPDQVVTSVVTLSATSDSGLPVSFAATGPAVITDGNILTFTGVGEVSIIASQSGNADWNAAAQVTNTFMVGEREKQFLAADFDGDGKADPAECEMSTGTWKMKMSANDYALAVHSGLLGSNGWVALAADFDGDGKADPAVYRENDGAWLFAPSSANYSVIIAMQQSLGGEGYSAVPSDYDGDGLGDPCVYKRVAGDWQVMLSSAGYVRVDKPALLGGAGYLAAPADFDGDGLADPAVYRESDGSWSIMLSSSDYALTITLSLGGAGYLAVPADYDGDGFADPAVKNETSDEWIVMLSTADYAQIHITLPFE